MKIMYKSLFLTEIYPFMLVRYYSKLTIETSITGIRSFIRFNNNQHPFKSTMNAFIKSGKQGVKTLLNLESFQSA